MKLLNISWATANKGILTKRYILFVYAEGKTGLLCRYTYVICQLGGPYCEKLWPKVWKCCPKSQVEGIILKSAVTVSCYTCRPHAKAVNDLFTFSSASLRSRLLLLNVATHTSRECWPGVVNKSARFVSMPYGKRKTLGKQRYSQQYLNHLIHRYLSRPF